MNRTELIDAVASETGLTKVDSKKAVDAVFTTITKALKENDKVGLIGFGTFGTSVRAARIGRNPQTGKPLEIKAKKVISFKVGRELSDSVQ
jgi:DNA-binding protein HU-beta